MELSREEWLEKRNAIELEISENRQKIEEHERRITNVENMTKEIHLMNENLGKICVTLDVNTKKLDYQDVRITKLENVPKVRWNAAVTAIISFLVGMIGSELINLLK